MAAAVRTPDNQSMIALGERLRALARSRGWSDAEVARRCGLSQNRYANYVANRHEPDLGTLKRICDVLGVTPDQLLLPEAGAVATANGPRVAIASAIASLDDEGLAILAAVADGLALRRMRASESEASRRSPPSGRATAPGKSAGGDASMAEPLFRAMRLTAKRQVVCWNPHRSAEVEALERRLGIKVRRPQPATTGDSGDGRTELGWVAPDVADHLREAGLLAPVVEPA